MQLELWPDSPQVTRDEVHQWVREIGLDPESWRGQYYIRAWNVAEKIADRKRQELRRVTHRPSLTGHDDNRLGVKQPVYWKQSAMREPEPINYFLLFVVVLVAVTGGNLLSNFITARVAIYGMEQASREAARTMNEQAARAKAQIEQLTREQQARTDHQTLLTRQRRAASPAGRKLEQH